MVSASPPWPSGELWSRAQDGARCRLIEPRVHPTSRPAAPTSTVTFGTSALARRVTADPRLRLRRDGPESDGARCVVYWMQRAQRADGNPALDLAIELANARGLPVIVFLAPVPFFPRANLRAYTFLFGGIPDLAREVESRGCRFVYRPFPAHDLRDFCDEVRPALVVGDENPLRETERWRQLAAERLAVPLVTVDTECLVPSAHFPKAEYAARTLRPKYHRVLASWLTKPTRTRARVPASFAIRGEDPAKASVPKGWKIDRSVAPVTTFDPGPTAARRALDQFLEERLAGYATTRNKPDLLGTSRLSPYLHFGHLGPQQVAWAVHESGAPAVDIEAFLEEFLVRRELAINYVLRNPQYDTLAGAPSWAQKTLDQHRADPRPYLYDAAELREARTHDDLWNATQREMVLSGHMQGYLRMYWVKKILEWTASPEDAYSIAIAMNDAFELDGRDPNGYCGIAWGIGGVHDRPWGPARPIFGMIRFMSGASTGRKFDKAAYLARVDALDGSG